MEYNVNISFPPDIILCLRETSENIAKDMKKTVAAKYYEERKLSLGQCAQLADMSEDEFIKFLSSCKISIFNFENEEELLEDVKNA